jgi:hypothetical protein
MPAWMPALWESFRFAWGGRWTRTPDAMHYEYMGTPAQAVQDTERARRELQGTEPTTEDDEMAFTATDPRNQNWHFAGVFRTPITWDQVNALAAQADRAATPYLGHITETALQAYRVAP